MKTKRQRKNGQLALRREPPIGKTYEDAQPRFSRMVGVLLEIAADLEAQGLWPPPEETVNTDDEMVGGIEPLKGRD